ncbi:glycosyltransferase [Uliginosibacterium paludis]|uniref:Glycosyltransferase n=1 Tax=Uliginosibacterium paludis TaxID=1615952 RepID=A0ABV2CJW3_9RHOO
MKILLVIPTVHGGGAEQVAAVLAREWSSAHLLRVMAWHVGAEQLDFGVPVEDLRLPAQTSASAKLRVFRRRVELVGQAVEGFRPDVVMAFMDEAGLVCSAAALAGGWRERLIVSMHHNPRWLGRSRRLLLAAAYRVPAAVVGVSQGVRSEMARSLHLDPIRLHDIPNPLVLRDDEGEQASRAVAARFAPGFLLFVGRLDRHTKGLDTLIDAFASLPRERPPLVIVGDGPDRAWLDGEVGRRGLADVHCVGWQADPHPFYRRAGVFVMSSRFEGWSNVLMEAMGQGCPVVATDCPYGPAEILGQEFQALQVPVDEPARLAAAIERLVALGDAGRRELGQSLRRRASRFAAPDVAARWLALAASLPGRHT